MNASKTDSPAGTDSSANLNDVNILLVEDSWHVGQAMKNLLRLMGANVAGPAATIAEAERLRAEHAPDLAIVDISLRGGERAFDLIDRLDEQGVRVIVISGYAEIPPASGKAVAYLQKPVSEAELLAALRPLIAPKTVR
jgi:DNA-binding NtrC family response regulator